MEPANSDIATGGAAAIAVLIIREVLVKIPWGRMFGRAPRENADSAVRKSEMKAAIIEHEKECRKCLDERFEKAQAVDQTERREFRSEVLNRLERMAERIDRLLERD